MKMLISAVCFVATCVFCLPSASCDESAIAADAASFVVRPIGYVRKSEGHTRIILDERYKPGLLGLEGFSHIYMFWWFDRNDTPGKRAILQVHPRGNRDNPLTGVFATRSPVRPNLIALTLCKVIAVKEHAIEIEKTDAFDGTPVLDIKPYIPGYDSAPDASVPDWLQKARKVDTRQKRTAAAAERSD